MSHEVICPHCTERMSAPTHLIGARVACKFCGQPFFVPAPVAVQSSSFPAMPTGPIASSASQQPVRPRPKPLHWTKPVALGVTILYVASVGLSFLWVFVAAGSHLQERQTADPDFQGARTVGTFIGGSLGLFCIVAFLTLGYGCAMALLLAIRSMSKRD